MLGLTEERERDGEGKSRAPGLGVYAAWLGGLPGWLSGTSNFYSTPLEDLHPFTRCALLCMVWGSSCCPCIHAKGGYMDLWHGQGAGGTPSQR